VTAAACRSCGRPVIPCPAPREGCGGWVHEQDNAHKCAPGGRGEASPAPREEKPWPVSGRDQPRPSLTAVAHEARLFRLTDDEARESGQAIRLECGPHGWARLIGDGHRLEDVVRADAMHEGGNP